MLNIFQISPIVYTVAKFNYSHRESCYRRMNSVKTQYVYRFLHVNKGSLTVNINGVDYICNQGDVIYLVPGERYRLIPCQQDFELNSVFFDFVEQKAKERNVNSCVYQNTFESKLASNVIDFLDAKVFNSSGVFSGVECAHYFNKMQNYQKESVGKFYLRICVEQIVYAILTSTRSREVTLDKANTIIDFISNNPQEDLSPKALENKFGYHKNYINELVKKKTGVSLGQLVQNSKMEYAKVLLLEMGFTPVEVSDALGFYDYSHFYKAFVKHVGKSPSQFIKG